MGHLRNLSITFNSPLVQEHMPASYTNENEEQATILLLTQCANIS